MHLLALFVVYCINITIKSTYLSLKVVKSRSTLAQHTPLTRAVAVGEHPQVAELLKVHPERALRGGSTAGWYGLLGSRSPLGLALDKESTEMVQALLDAGADPNQAGLTVGLLGLLHGLLMSTSPLYMAVDKGSTEMVQALLDTGADPNQTGETVGPLGLLMSLARILSLSPTPPPPFDLLHVPPGVWRNM